MEQTDTYTKLMQKALRFVSFRRRSVHEVATYLTKTNSSDQDSQTEKEKVLKRLAELGYLDDKQFVLSFARDRLRFHPRGLPVIRQELLQKGIAADTIAEAFSELETEGIVSVEDAIRRLVIKKFRSVGNNFSPVERQKLIATISRKGFPFAKVASIVDECIQKD